MDCEDGESIFCDFVEKGMFSSTGRVIAVQIKIVHGVLPTTIPNLKSLLQLVLTNEYRSTKGCRKGVLPA
jgi:hypothetical protein